MLISNMDEMTPDAVLGDCFSRVKVEQVFKIAKDYLRLLPITKWTETAIRGMVLHDLICTTALLQVRKAVAVTGRPWSPKGPVDRHRR